MTGTLTNEITRLCGEIAALHQSRATLCDSLVQGRDDLKEAVSQMQAGFRSAHAEMANQTRARLREFSAHVSQAVQNLREGVRVFREQTLGDVAGARRAWCANILAQRPATNVAPEPPGATGRNKKKKR